MLQGLLAPFRVVLQRSVADWLIVVATWLVILCATTLVAIGVLYGDAVALTGLRQLIASQPATSTSVQVQMRVSDDELPDARAALDRQVGRILGWTGGELITVMHSDSFALPGQDSEKRTNLVEFGAYEGLDDHASLTDGRLPAADAEPMEVAVSDAVAEQLGLAVGDTLELASTHGGDRSLSIEIVGTWQPDDPTDPYWRGDPFELDGVRKGSSFTTHGPMIVTPDDLVARTVSGDISLEYRALPEFENLAVEDVRWMRSDVAALDRRLSDQLGERAFFQIDTALDTILADAGQSLLVSRSGVVVMTIQYAVLAGYALLLVAGLLVEQRRVETSLLRSRGASVGHVVLMSFLEALVLVVPAALAAPWIATALLDLLNVAGPLADAGVRIETQVSQPVLIAVGIAAVAAIIGLVLPALASGRGLSAVRQSLSRQGNRTLAQRLGIDMALVVLAAVGLWQLRQYGAPLTQSVRGSIGLDPLLVAAPAIGLLAGAIVALRLVPLAAEIGERILSTRRGLVAPLGARQLSRRPLRYTRSALLLMLAAALGTFAGAYGSTWTRSQADQAAYRTGGDVRVVLSEFPDLAPSAMGAAYRSVDGVEAALPVVREEFDVGDESGQLLAFDSRTAAGIVHLRPDLAPQPIEPLLGRLASAPTDATSVYAGPARAFRLEVLANLATWRPPPPASADEEPIEVAPLSPNWPGIIPALVVRDADGLIYRLEGSRVQVAAGVEKVEFPVAADPEAGEIVGAVELLGIELAVDLPETAAVGEIGIGPLEVREGPGSDTWRRVPTDSFDWRRSDAGAGPGEGTTLSPREGRVTLEQPIAGGQPGADAILRVSLPGGNPGPVPALAGTSLLEATGVAVGDTIDLGTLGTRRNYEIVGTVEAWPTLDPAEPFLVADLGALARSDYAGGELTTPDEWWFDVRDDSGASVAETLRGEPYSASRVIAEDDLHRELLSDPIALGMIGSLALGALAAVIFAAIGFIVSATVSTRERLGEFALLQAIGLSHRQLSAWISMENAFLLLIGLLTGTALGLILAWVVLPFVTLTQEATIAVPPVEVVIPWGIYGLLYLAAAGALAVTVVVIGNLLARVRVSGVLRSGGE